MTRRKKSPYTDEEEGTVLGGDARARDEGRTFGSGGGSVDESAGPSGRYDEILGFQAQERSGRAAEDRAMEQYLRTLQGQGGQIREELGLAQRALRGQAARGLAQLAGRQAHQGMGGGGTFGTGTLTKQVGQGEGQLQAQFGPQIRSAARDLATARVEREQQKLARMVKPGTDLVRIQGEIETLAGEHGGDWKYKASRGMHGKRPTWQQMVNDLNALLGTTEDPIARQAIRTALNNMQEGRHPLETA